MNIKIWHTRQGRILILNAKLVILKKLDMLSLLTKENLLIQVKSQQSQTTIDMVTVPIFLLFYYWNVWFFRVGCIKPIFLSDVSLRLSWILLGPISPTFYAQL